MKKILSISLVIVASASASLFLLTVDAPEQSGSGADKVVSSLPSASKEAHSGRPSVGAYLDPPAQAPEYGSVGESAAAGDGRGAIKGDPIHPRMRPLDLVTMVFEQDPQSRQALARINERRRQVRARMWAGASPGAHRKPTGANEVDEPNDQELARAIVDSLELPSNLAELEEEYDRRRTLASERALLKQLPSWMTDPSELKDTVAGLDPAGRLRFHELMTERMADWTHAGSR